MYIDYYNSLKQYIAANMPEIKHIDWYNGQYTRYQEVKATALPAVYVEFGNPINWQTQGNGLQVAVDASIRFHLVLFDVNDNPEQNLNLAKTLHKKLHLFKLTDTQGTQISTGLMRTSSELVTDFDQLKIIILEYSTALYDYSAMPQTTQVTVQPNVSGGF